MLSGTQIPPPKIFSFELQQSNIYIRLTLIEIKLNTKKIIAAAAGLLIIVFVNACCSCGGEIKNENTVKGYITMVGNEPFARLAVMVDTNKVYLLECEKDLKEELMKNQGRYYTIEFKANKYEHEIPVLIVEKAVPLNEK